MGKSSKDKYELGKEMFLQGKTTMNIAKELNISRSRFSRYLRECGIDSQQYHKECSAGWFYHIRTRLRCRRSHCL